MLYFDEDIDPIMSSAIPAVHLEIISPVTSLPRASPPIPARDEPPRETVAESHAPAEGQQVFTHAQLRAIPKARQIAITALVILSNLIQVHSTTTRTRHRSPLTTTDDS